MPLWLENQQGIHTNQITTLQDKIAQLTARIITLEQAQQNTGYGYAQGGGGGGIFYAITPASGSWGATGTFPSLTAGSFTANVYASGGSGPALTLATSSATVYNWFPASPANSLVIEIFVDGSGNYVTGPQSCT